MLAPLLRTLDVRSNNAAHCPVIEALDLLRRYTERPGTVRFYDPEDDVPLDGIVPGDWREAVVDHDGRTERVP